MDNQINQLFDTLIEVKSSDIERIERRMVRDKETLALYRRELAEYEAQKAEASK